MGIIKKLFGGKEKAEAELRAEILEKAMAHMDANSESAGSSNNAVKDDMPVYLSNDKNKKKNIRTVMLEIAAIGEAGVLAISISDKTGLSQHDTSTALVYLSDSDYVESVNSPAGMKYFLTNSGRKFCISKKFNSGF